MKKTIAVYGASSADIDPRFVDAGRETGRLIAKSGRTLICGGGRTGLMAAAIDGAHDAGGHAVGVLPAFMIENGWNHQALDSMIETDGMHTRKRTMLERSDAIIALPGGTGTLEELLEAITWRQLNLWHGQIVILNTLGYYNPLIAQLNNSIDSRFMRPDHRRLWTVADTPSEAIAAAITEIDNSPFSQKIVRQEP